MGLGKLQAKANAPPPFLRKCGGALRMLKTEGLERLGHGKHCLRVALSAGADGLGELDHAVGVDQEGRAVAHAGSVKPDAVVLRHLALRVEVGKKGEVDVAETSSPCLVAVRAVDRDTQDLGVAGLELSEEFVEAWDLDASGGREVERVEHHEDVLTLKAGQGHRFTGVAVEREVGRGGAFFKVAHRNQMGERGPRPPGFS